MNVQEIKRKLQIQEWSAQVKSCKESGLTVKEWCAENNINIKTYYNHVKRVREETLEVIESQNTKQLAQVTGNSISQIQTESPVFAAVPVSQEKSANITVWIGGHAVDIQNGAEDILIEQTLRVVSRL